MTTPAIETPAPSAQRVRSVKVGIALAILVAVIVLAFSWPSVTSDPRNVPVGIMGSTDEIAVAMTLLEQHFGGEVKLTEYPDKETAIAAIKQRDVYGALILGSSPELLTATAASPPVAQLLTGVAGFLQQASTASNGSHWVFQPTDIVPLLESDPRGSSIAAAAFPLVLGGMIGGMAISLTVSGIRPRLATLGVYCVAAGLFIAGILQSWFGVLDGNYVVTAAAFSLSLLAIAATIIGFETLLGRAGLAVGSIIFMLIANPISGASIPKEFLPQPWGELGQWFPPGAGIRLVRELTYFPDASKVFPWSILAGWVALGLILTAISYFRDASTAESDHSIPESNSTPLIP